MLAATQHNALAACTGQRSIRAHGSKRIRLAPAFRLQGMNVRRCMHITGESFPRTALHTRRNQKVCKQEANLRKAPRVADDAAQPARWSGSRCPSVAAAPRHLHLHHAAQQTWGHRMQATLITKPLGLADYTPAVRHRYRRFDPAERGPSTLKTPNYTWTQQNVRSILQPYKPYTQAERDAPRVTHDAGTVMLVRKSTSLCTSAPPVPPMSPNNLPYQRVLVP
jgi:hypothetical protein